MDLKILNKKDNPLLHRLELEAELTATGPTPSNKDVAKELSKQTKANENLIIIKHIYSRFGTNQSDVLAYIYNDEERMKEIEITKEVKEEKPEEKPAPAAPAEKPSNEAALPAPSIAELVASSACCRRSPTKTRCARLYENMAAYLSARNITEEF